MYADGNRRPSVFFHHQPRQTTKLFLHQISRAWHPGHLPTTSPSARLPARCVRPTCRSSPRRRRSLQSGVPPPPPTTPPSPPLPPSPPPPPLTPLPTPPPRRWRVDRHCIIRNRSMWRRSIIINVSYCYTELCGFKTPSNRSTNCRYFDKRLVGRKAHRVDTEM